MALAIEEIGYDADLHRFVDLEEAPISTRSSCTPGSGCSTTTSVSAHRAAAETMWIEPLWKTLLSNKAILAVLWGMYPGHPNLLPA